jgi:predicted nucleic acid-binding protein
MVERTEVYVDTSAFIAFLDRSDTHHARFRRLFSEPSGIFTTTLVIAEGHAWFLRRYDRFRALQFLAMIEDLEPLKVVQVGSAEQAGATQLLRRFSDQDLTLTDAVGLHAMQEHRVRTCWSTDFHLGLTGVKLVVNEP